MSPSDFVNHGFIQFVPPDAESTAADQHRTIVVSGIGRSGTTMIARMISALGVDMGPAKSPICEDEEILPALLYFDHARFNELVRVRNEQHSVWGFKFPSLHNHLFPPQLSSLRNPRLVIVTRDPVAVAVRSNMSDGYRQNSGFVDLNHVSEQQVQLFKFVRHAPCPSLLLSYEKALIFPESTITALANYCGIDPSQDMMNKAMTLVNPNNVAYINLFHAVYKGHVDGVLDNCLVGWCHSNMHNEPVFVELLLDGVVVACVRADTFRGDLLEAGIGSGNHAFRFDLSNRHLDLASILVVRTSTDHVVIEGSGVTVRSLLTGSAS